VAVIMVDAHHWRGAHGKLGLAIMILACVQVLVLACLCLFFVLVVVRWWWWRFRGGACPLTQFRECGCADDRRRRRSAAAGYVLTPPPWMRWAPARLSRPLVPGCFRTLTALCARAACAPRHCHSGRCEGAHDVIDYHVIACAGQVHASCVLGALPQERRQAGAAGRVDQPLPRRRQAARVWSGALLFCVRRVSFLSIVRAPARARVHCSLVMRGSHACWRCVAGYVDVAGDWEAAVYGALVAVGTVRVVVMGLDVHSVGGCLTPSICGWGVEIAAGVGGSVRRVCVLLLCWEGCCERQAW
jgi:hypothetical protein